jgi:hypothetical protein
MYRDYEQQRIDRIRERFPKPEEGGSINIYQSATSNDAGQHSDVNYSYNHYEIHIHFPSDAKPEMIRDAMAALRNPNEVKPDDNTTVVKKSSWWSR